MGEDIRYCEHEGVEIPQNKRYITKLSGVDIIVEDVNFKRKDEGQ